MDNNILLHSVVVTIFKPPENTTFCRGHEVIISCHYMCAATLPVTWMINGTSFNQSAIMNSPLYQLNNPTTPMSYSLTVSSVDYPTTFQCVIHSTPNTISTRGTVIMYTGMCTYTHV